MTTFDEMLLLAVLPALVLAVALVAYRLALGPSLPDRVVASDLMATIGIAIIAVYSMATDQPAMLDVATVLALIAFLGTIAFANYLMRRR